MVHLATTSLLLPLLFLYYVSIGSGEGTQEVPTAGRHTSYNEGSVDQGAPTRRQLNDQLQVRGVSHPLEWLTTSPNVSRACRAGWDYLWTHNHSVIEVKPELGVTSLAERALDAFGKPQGGNLEGNLYAYGSYDECLSTDHVQYCIVHLNAATLPLPVALTTMQLGVCVPHSCTEKDAAITAEMFLAPLHDKGYLLGGPYHISLDSKQVQCQGEKHGPYNAGAIITMVVCCLFLVAVLVGTGVHWVLEKLKVATVTQNEDRMNSVVVLLQVITSFSLYKNVPAVFATSHVSSSIRCLNGIRVISMLWIILHHVSRFIEVWWDYNDLFKAEGQFILKTASQGFTAVNSFFLLSGILVTHHRLCDMDRKSGHFSVCRYYIHRYLRLTPTYAFLLLFYWFLANHLADGPDYHVVDSSEHQVCARYWWANLLYIQNFWPGPCMPWSWYLACDMQFYWVSPLLIVLLYNSLPLGLAAIGVFFLGTIVAGAAIGAYYIDSAVGDLVYITEIYLKPYCRMAPWLLGIILGYSFFKKATIHSAFHNRIVKPWMYYLVAWALAAIFIISAVYGIPRLDNMVVYASFYELTFSIGVALVVIACQSGYGGWVNSFLSMTIWLPLSRLTYATYLIHPIVIIVFYRQLRDPYVHYTDVTFVVYAVAITAISYAAAAVVAVFVEFPLANVEKLLFNVAEGKRLTCASCQPRSEERNENGTDLSLLQVSRCNDAESAINK